MKKGDKLFNLKVYNVLTDDPHIQSQSSLILLKRQLAEQDDTVFLRQKYLPVRERFLNKRLQETGMLKCAYCGREDLEMGLPSINSKLATVDHVIPVSKGGKIYDESNFEVSCRLCNGDKGSSKDHKAQIEPEIVNLDIQTIKKIRQLRRKPDEIQLSMMYSWVIQGSISLQQSVILQRLYWTGKLKHKEHANGKKVEIAIGS